MWDRIMDAGLITGVAVALFAVFTVILFAYERREEKKKANRRPRLRVIRYEKTDRAA